LVRTLVVQRSRPEAIKVDEVKRLAVTPAGAHRLDNPADVHRALSNGVCGVAGTEGPVHMAAMTCVVIADHHRGAGASGNGQRSSDKTGGSCS
jgi:hypothetical protein